MKKKIFRGICLTSLVSVLLVSLGVLALIYNKIDRDTWQSLQTEASYIAVAVEQQGVEYLENTRGFAHRVTLVDAEGGVVYDGAGDAGALENHADRPEIRTALTGGAGQATRHSETMGKRTFYYALRLTDGSVLRVSTTVDTLMGETLRFVPWLLVVCVLVVLASMLMARRLTRGVIRPINEIDLKDPLAAGSYDELSPLLRRIASQNKKIQDTVETLRERQQEFDTITENLDEGLVVLNNDSVVLSINSSAKHILGVAGEAEGQLLLELNRDLTLDKAVGKALKGKKREATLAMGESSYHLTATPAYVEGKVNGVVLLLVDETEKLAAETLRREFSANVSHELKTPLTSISGYAEIMQKGLVQPQDLQDFAGRIREEAERLIALVSDIIKLSKLDERETTMEPETVDLHELALATAQGLEAAARTHGIAIEVQGTPVEMKGIRSIISEVVYNLCDNALKYNKAGGHVVLKTWQEGTWACLSVADDGMGIPPEQQPRVFERFYRGDTSHSSEISGTGLGLSIVKHGVAFHDGEITLESTPGKGSTFTVRLPLE